MRPVFTQHLLLGEGPRWCTSGLWWVDIVAGRVFRSKYDTNIGTLLEPSSWDLLAQVGMVGALAPTRTEAMVLATQSGWQLFSPSSGICQLIANPTPDPSVRFNDGAVDPAGRFVAGTMPLTMPEGAGKLWSLETDGSYRLLMEGLTCPNGIAWSDTGQEMYFIDSPQKAIQVFAYDPSVGTMGKELRRIDVSDEDGVPDGCCLDGQGRLWVGFWAGSSVCCYDLTSGTQLTKLTCPASQITALAVVPGGDLFITSSALEIDEPEAGNCFLSTSDAMPRPAASWQGDV